MVRIMKKIIIIGSMFLIATGIVSTFCVMSNHRIETKNQEKQIVMKKDIADCKVGEVLIAEQIDWNDISQYFVAEDICEGDAIYQRIIGKSYVENEHIVLNELVYLKMLHYNYDGEIQVGEMIVNRQIGEECLNIFQRLFDKKYEIAQMRLVDDFWAGDSEATDAASIKANNTSAFHYRNMIGGKKISKHALGLAIDINPYQNPYVPTKNGVADYSALDEQECYYAMNRNVEDAHVITEEDVVFQFMTECGFSWGGDWKSLKDYQHFEK